MSDEWTIIDRSLYLTEDGGRVVEEGDPKGRWLHWPKGMRVRTTEYEKLTKPVAILQLPDQEPKMVTVPANKRRRPQDNK